VRTNTDSKRVAQLTADVSGPDDQTLPHLRCTRCDKVWLLVAATRHVTATICEWPICTFALQFGSRRWQ